MKVKTETREYGNLLLKIKTDATGREYTLASEKHCLLHFWILDRGGRLNLPKKNKTQ